MAQRDFLIRIKAVTTDAVNKMRGLGRVWDRTVGGMARGVFNLRNAFAALGASLLTRYVSTTVDQFTLLRGQLKLVTESEENLIEVEEKLFQVAQRTRSAYEPTVKLYARVARNARELGLEQEQLLKLTTAINQSLQIGGQNAQEAAGGVIQLSQALASGELRGEELRSVLENMPRLTQAIADGLKIQGSEPGELIDVTIGKIRELAEQGELTSDVLVRAILSQAEVMEQEYGQLPRTIGQSLQQIRNTFERTLAETNVDALNDSLDEFRQIISEPATIEAIKTFGTALIDVFSFVVKRGRDLISITQQIGQNLARLSVGAKGLFFDLNQDELLEKEQELLKRLKEREQLLSGGDNAAANRHRNDTTLVRIREELEQVRLLIKSYNDLSAAQTGLREIDISTLPQRRELSGPVVLPGEGGIDRDKLNAEFEKNRQQLERQLALFNENTNAAALLFEIQHGGLKDLLPEQQAQLKFLATSLDLQETLAEQREQEDRERQQIRADLESLQQALSTETELIEQQYQERLQIIRDALNEEELTRDQARDLELRAAESHAEMLKELQDRKQREALEAARANMSEFAVQAARNIESAFGDFFFDIMQGNFDDLVGNFKRTIDRMVADLLASKLLEFLLGDFGTTGNLGGAVGGFVNKFVGLSGGKAAGGRASAGDFFMAGEVGPEPIFLGDQAANVMPNQLFKKLAGGGGNNITVNIQTPDVESFRKSQGQVMTEIGMMVDKAIKRHR